VFKLYSKGCEYAIRALVFVVTEHDGERFQASTICEQVGVPEPYTRKILQALVHDGLLKAVRGPSGGYQLTREPDDISVLSVILAVDGQDSFDGCIMGLSKCGSEQPCPLHEVWAPAKEGLMERLKGVTLQHMIDAV
jgi:Rrf2 family protein